MKAKNRTSRTVRRSVAIQRQLVEEALAAAPPDLSDNWNGVVTVALKEYVARKKEREFEEAMARMARDPQIRALCGEIAREFLSTEEDGLSR